MATFGISCRFKYDADYSDRWSSTVDAIKRQHTGAMMAWEEMTSFVLITSNRTATDLANSIYYGSKLNAVKDTLLVINTSNNTYATVGEITYPATLDAFFPFNALSRAIGA